MKRIFTMLLLFALTALSAWSQVPELVKDIYPGSFQDGVNINLEKPLAVFNDRIYFAGNDGNTGTELWVSDGTEAGTQLLKDLNEGPESGNCQRFVPAKDYLFFVAQDEEHGIELWRTDGTADGTILLKDINPGPASGPYDDELFRFYTDLVLNGDVLYFSADDGTSGEELWRSDGTTSGTFMVTDLDENDSSSPGYLSPYNGEIYFRTNVSGAGLMKTDGTESGTVTVRSDVVTLGGTECNGYLIFIGSAVSATPPFDFGEHIYRTDGTEAGTVKVKEINETASGDGFTCEPDETIFRCIGDVVYFIGDDGNRRELWRTDGTEAGTYKVNDIGQGGGCARVHTVLDNILYYSFDDGVHGDELWRTDGTANGTYLVKDVLEGEVGSLISNTVENMGTTGDKILFSALNEFPDGERLWMTDGTETGTKLVADGPIFQDTNPHHFLELGDYAYFVMDADFKGDELWRLSLLPVSTETAFAEGFDLVLSPSATNGFFSLNTNGNTSMRFDVNLVSLSGNIVKRWENARPGDILDASGVAGGIYLVQAYNGKGAATKKLIITD